MSPHHYNSGRKEGLDNTLWSMSACWILMEERTRMYQIWIACMERRLPAQSLRKIPYKSEG